MELNNNTLSLTGTNGVEEFFEISLLDERNLVFYRHETTDSSGGYLETVYYLNR